MRRKLRSERDGGKQRQIFAVVPRVVYPFHRTMINERYVAAKERWAAKMSGKAKPQVCSTDRLPPGQHEVRNFPVLDLGVRPEVPLDKWELHIHGKVENPVTLSWEQFMALPQFEDVSDFHCVTTWSQFAMRFKGVAFL